MSTSRESALENFYMVKEADPAGLLIGAGLSGAGGALVGGMKNRGMINHIGKEYGLSPEEMRELYRERPAGAGRGLAAGLGGHLIGTGLGSSLGRGGAGVGGVVGTALGLGYLVEGEKKRYRRKARLLAEERRERRGRRRR